MKNKEPNFQFYVVNYNSNSKECEMFNIFNNIHVYDECLRLVKKHLRNKKEFPFEEFKEEVRRTIAWQEWGRFEYECSVGAPFEDNLDNLKKVDCYWQALPNIDLICEMLISRYKASIKEDSNNAKQF